MTTDTGVSDCCLTTPRIVPRDYTRKGSDKQTAGGLRFYEVAEHAERTDVVVLFFHDIVGNNNPQSDQQADRISKGLGVRVVAPYWYGSEDGWTGPLGPGMDRAAFTQWKSDHANEKDIDGRKEEILEYLKTEGVSKIAVIGFCFGGATACRWASDARFAATASIHGRAYTAENGTQIRVPFLNIASQNESDDQKPFKEAIPDNVREKYDFHLFDDVPHGFAAARGDWVNNETHRTRAEEAINIFVQFVKTNVLVE